MKYERGDVWITPKIFSLNNWQDSVALNVKGKVVGEADFVDKDPKLHFEL